MENPYPQKNPNFDMQKKVVIYDVTIKLLHQYSYSHIHKLTGHIHACFQSNPLTIKTEIKAS